MHSFSITGIMPLTTTIALFSTKTPSTKTYNVHRGYWKQQRLKISLTSYMPYLQEMLVDECIEELERKEKRSEDFINSLDFLKNSPFHPLFPFLGQSPDCYSQDIGSFDNFLLLNDDTPFFILPYHSHNDRDICVQVGLITIHSLIIHIILQDWASKSSSPKPICWWAIIEAIHNLLKWNHYEGRTSEPNVH